MRENIMHYPYNFYIPYSQNDKNTNSDKKLYYSKSFNRNILYQFKITTSFLNDEKNKSKISTENLDFY